MGTDHEERQWPCLCGKGIITVTQSSPDHPWVKSHQVSYAASISCAECEAIYRVDSGHYGKPYIVKRAFYDAKTATNEEARSAVAKFAESDLAKTIPPKIAAEVDEQVTAAAKHRVLQKYGISRGSVATFRKGQTDGASNVLWLDGTDLARIGATTPLGEDCASEFQAAYQQLESLKARADAIKIDPVLTGIDWLKA